jgi:hypothetical protein
MLMDLRAKVIESIVGAAAIDTVCKEEAGTEGAGDADEGLELVRSMTSAFFAEGSFLPGTTTAQFFLFFAFMRPSSPSEPVK